MLTVYTRYYRQDMLSEMCFKTLKNFLLFLMGGTEETVPRKRWWLKKLDDVYTLIPYIIFPSLNIFNSFFFKHLYWSIIALQWRVSFCFITKWISYTYTYIPISPPSCVSLPPSLSHPSRWSQSTELISLCYAAASH